MLERIYLEDKRIDEILNRYIVDFPKEERKSIDQVKKLLATDWYQIHGMYDKEELLAYAFIDVVSDSNLLWLEYFAIDENRRGQGWGSAILLALKDHFKEYDGMIFEIEPVDETKPLTLKRKIFYERLGASLITKPYILPNEHGGENLWLYYLPIVCALNKDRLIETMRFLYQEVHSDIENYETILEHNCSLLMTR